MEKLKSCDNSKVQVSYLDAFFTLLVLENRISALFIVKCQRVEFVLSVYMNYCMKTMQMEAGSSRYLYISAN